MAGFVAAQSEAAAFRSSLDAASSSLGLSGSLHSRQQPEQILVQPPAPTEANRRASEAYRGSEHSGHQSDSANGSETLNCCAELSLLPRPVKGPVVVPSQSTLNFWQADGSFKCDWGALKTGEAFCSSVKAACAFCLLRALGGPSQLASVLLEKLRAGAKVAIEDEVARLVQSVKSYVAASSEQGNRMEPEAATEATQQLMKHPALQAVAFLSVHERRLAVFEIWLDRWQVLSRDCKCTCGSAEAASEGLLKIASGDAGKTSERESGLDTKAAIASLRAKVAQLRQDAQKAQQCEDATVAEARSLSVALVTKQQQLLLATERLKALQKVQSDPTFSLMLRAQQQEQISAAEGTLASRKEPFVFIAEKCRKLAHLASVMQQQHIPQSCKVSLMRPSCRVPRYTTDVLENGAEEDGLALVGGLRGLQTPHASLHSHRSQRARISSCLTSPISPAVQSPPRTKETAVNGPTNIVQREGPPCALGSGNADSSPHRATDLDARGEAAEILRRAGQNTSPTRSLAHNLRAASETEGSKRRCDTGRLQASRQKHTTFQVVFSNLDIDEEVGGELWGGESRKHPAEDTNWIDSFLGKRPEKL